MTDELSVHTPGRPRGLIALGAGGLLLTVLTLGAARFWYVTSLRRFFWSRTQIGAFPLCYTGTPFELLFGLSIALWVLVPIYVVMLFAVLSLDGWTLAVNAMTLTVLTFLTQVAIYRARRYRLTRTFWRGLGFHQKGSAIRYALLWILGAIATFLSFGLALPLIRQKLYGYRVNHTHFGGQRAYFQASARPLLQAYLRLYLPLAGLLLVLAVYYWPDLTALSQLPWIVELVLDGGFAALSLQQQVLLYAWLQCGALLGIGIPILLAVLGPSYMTFEFRHFTSNVSFGTVTLSSSLRVRDVLQVWAIFGLVLCILVLAITGCVLAGLTFFRFSPGVITPEAPFGWSVWAALAGFYGLCLYLFLLCHLLFLRYPLWRVKASSITLAADDALNSAAWPASQMRRGGVFAEGITDALGVGGF